MEDEFYTKEWEREHLEFQSKFEWPYEETNELEF